MKLTNSLRSLRHRDRNCKVVRRRGAIYIINSVKPKFKCRQGQPKSLHK